MPQTSSTVRNDHDVGDDLNNANNDISPDDCNLESQHCGDCDHKKENEKYDEEKEKKDKKKTDYQRRGKVVPGARRS